MNEFHVDLNREQAIAILETKAGLDTWEVMCKEYGPDEDWVGVYPDDLPILKDCPEYKTFALWIKPDKIKEWYK